MSHLLRQPKLKLLPEHTLDCRIIMQSRPVQNQCTACGTSSCRKRPLRKTVYPSKFVWGHHNDFNMLSAIHASAAKLCASLSSTGDFHGAFTSILNFVKPCATENPVAVLADVQERETQLWPHGLDRPEADSFRPIACPLGHSATIAFTPIDIRPTLNGMEHQQMFLGRHRKVRPFEVLYVDNKSCPGPVVGGDITMFIIVCASTTAAFKIDVRKKSANGIALKAFASQWGITKLPYKCTVCSDNCGSMQLVRDMAHELHMAHDWLPPHGNSANIVEKVIDVAIGAAGATCTIWRHLKLLFAMCRSRRVQQVVHVTHCGGP